VPSTVGGILLFVIFLVPGFLYYVQRRRWVEQKSESSLVETARLVSVSVLTNLLAVGVFAIVRWRLPKHTPDISSLTSEGWKYVWARPGYMLLWSLGLLLLSIVFSLLIALLSRTKVNIRWLAPDIVQSSAWMHLFKDEVPPISQPDQRSRKKPKRPKKEGLVPFVGIYLHDGTYVSGFVDWFSTEIDEVPDRDLILAAPITIRKGGRENETTFSRLIISAREVSRIFVSYLPPPPDGGEGDEAEVLVKPPEGPRSVGT